MSHTMRPTLPTTAPVDVFGFLQDGAATVRTAIHQGLRRAYDRNTMRALSDAQLADAGIDRDAVLANRPSIAIEAGLMARLMALS